MTRPNCSPPWHCDPRPRSPWLALFVALATGCLDLGAVPVEEQTCAEQTDPDPLVGAWQGEGTCEFFSNGRYDDACGVTRHLSGFPEQWSRLEDGRYYFGTSSLGSHAGECVAEAEFAERCEQVTLAFVCNGKREHTLELERK
jgi:hypothetical protein